MNTAACRNTTALTFMPLDKLSKGVSTVSEKDRLSDLHFSFSFVDSGLYGSYADFI